MIPPGFACNSQLCPRTLSHQPINEPLWTYSAKKKVGGQRGHHCHTLTPSALFFFALLDCLFLPFIAHPADASLLLFWHDSKGERGDLAASLEEVSLSKCSSLEALCRRTATRHLKLCLSTFVIWSCLNNLSIGGKQYLFSQLTFTDIRLGAQLDL